VAAVGAEGVPEKFITFFKFICFITFATFHLRSHLEMPELGTSSGMTPDPSWKSPGPTEWVPAQLVAVGVRARCLDPPPAGGVASDWPDYDTDRHMFDSSISRAPAER
jgi:hypothetical protein